jgi:hypothetical protein
MQVFPHYL